MFILSLFLAVLVSASPEHIFKAPKQGYNVLNHTLVREIDQLRLDWGIKGASVAVVQLKDGVWEQDTVGFGIADEAGNAVTEHTLFGIAANSKLFTAIATGLIVANETSGLTWTTKVKDIVPDWELMDPTASNGTDLIDLLSHRTGLPRHDGFYGADETKSNVISRMRHLRPSTEFRQAWQYNNIAYLVASTLPEYIYGIPFETFVQDNVFDPLGMTETTYNVPRENRSDAFMRRGMDLQKCEEDLKGKSFSKECLGESVDIGFMPVGSMMAGPGGVVTSAKDMAIWLKALLMQGRSSTNESVIPPEVIAAVATPYTIPRAPPSLSHDADIISPMMYGAGQAMYSYRGHYIIEHGGTLPGQKSQVTRVPGAGIGVSVMVNDHEFGAGFYQVVRRRILDHLLGLESIDWASQVKAGMVHRLQTAHPPSRAANATIDNDLDSIPGTYTDAAYGQMTICALHDKTAACRKTLAGNPFPVQNDVPTFVAYFPKFWFDYLLFTHCNGSTFTVTLSSTYAERNVTISSTLEWHDAVFDGEGMAWTRGAWGAGPGVAKRSLANGLKESAEVWFEKQ